MSGPLAATLPDGRLHLQHGPIDLIVAVDGGVWEVRAAYAAAVARFADILPTLCGELALLRAPLGAEPPPLAGPVARRMLAACWPHREVFITPMAAVAGAVADEILAAILAAAPRVRRASVNNGGDIALHLTDGETLTVGVATPSPPRGEGRGEGETPLFPARGGMRGLSPSPNPLPGGERAVWMDGTFPLTAALPVRGVATSGWRGRSQSLGIADAATVLARSAAEADAAATMVANAIDVAHPAVMRLPARAVKDDSDLGERLVTVAVGALPDAAVRAALDNGVRVAERLRTEGLIWGAVLVLAGAVRVVGPLPGLMTDKNREAA
ncbi:UPF0280 family protein [Azospirillum sp. RWY-5-1]|uniref:UPF0280 family protein n=1 Tax=Azospirillum oleiclasticum TaxID=2735135 RepID=A0ABX2T9J6_9PROT|nr:UPF0280 family protein [Azospirillum oleiclasticum]NYZ12708.1 UPF0280 family protein [Azospirillum oleiclasticum]NYZ19868.1 UPF0280 family protein [Azospirillum oleiclasticum]